jgi:hypothetical protein
MTPPWVRANDIPCDPAQPKAVIIRIVQTHYLPEQIPSKWLEALEREVALERLARVTKAYRRLQTGDLVRIEYAPRQGTLMWINSKLVARLPGQRLIDSILVAWASGLTLTPSSESSSQSSRANTRQSPYRTAFVILLHGLADLHGGRLHAPEPGRSGLYRGAP